MQTLNHLKISLSIDHLACTGYKIATQVPRSNLQFPLDV